MLQHILYDILIVIGSLAAIAAAGLVNTLIANAIFGKDGHSRHKDLVVEIPLLAEVPAIVVTANLIGHSLAVSWGNIIASLDGAAGGMIVWVLSAMLVAGTSALLALPFRKAADGAAFGLTMVGLYVVLLATTIIVGYRYLTGEPLTWSRYVEHMLLDPYALQPFKISAVWPLAARLFQAWWEWVPELFIAAIFAPHIPLH